MPQNFSKLFLMLNEMFNSYQNKHFIMDTYFLIVSCILSFCKDRLFILIYFKKSKFLTHLKSGSVEISTLDCNTKSRNTLISLGRHYLSKSQVLRYMFYQRGAKLSV